MRESLILDLSCLPIHQCRGQDKIFFKLDMIFIPIEQRLFEIIVIEQFIIIHQLDELSACFFDAGIPVIAGIIMRKEIGIRIGDATYRSFLQKWMISDPQSILLYALIHDENNLEIFEGLSLETFHDVLHILISSGRNDYAEYHTSDEKSKDSDEMYLLKMEFQLVFMRGTHILKHIYH